MTSRDGSVAAPGTERPRRCQLIPRPSFFQLDNTRKARARGEPWHLIVHEDVLIFRAPRKSLGSRELEGPQCEPGHPSMAPLHRPAAAYQTDGTRAA
ncbi:MAG: hypothetical protein WBH47_14980 [Streptosporangiaceae bacterium]